MRQKRTAQSSIYEVFAGHELGRELDAMSRWLDEHREVLEWVASDVCRDAVNATGRSGLSVESVLRCALLKQHRQLSYEELAFHLHDSASFQAFARLPLHWCPKKSVLQALVSAIRAETWERLNQALVTSAREARVEPGQRIRIDSTGSDSPIHEPSDSSLLWDAVRVLSRLLKRARRLPGAPPLAFVNHTRVAKKRARAIFYARGAAKREVLYRDLLQVTRATLGYAIEVCRCLQHSGVAALEFELWRTQLNHYIPLIEGVIAQTQRRVCDKQSVPASDKVVSLFEPHTDILVKGSRQVQYGHKLNLVSGRSALILDVVIEQGNPADAERFIPMLARHRANYGFIPRQVAADGGYASAANVRDAKALGVQDVAFHKKRGLSIETMVSSQWIYRRLRNFRAGIEAAISCLKRAYGLARCTWKGLEHFQAYVWSSIVAYNLALFARLKPKPT